MNKKVKKIKKKNKLKTNKKKKKKSWHNANSKTNLYLFFTII